MFVLHYMFDISDQDPEAHCKHREKVASSGILFDQTPCSLIVETHCLIVTNDLQSCWQVKSPRSPVAPGTARDQHWKLNNSEYGFLLIFGVSSSILCLDPRGRGWHSHFRGHWFWTAAALKVWALHWWAVLSVACSLCDQFSMNSKECWVHWISIG